MDKHNGIRININRAPNDGGYKWTPPDAATVSFEKLLPMPSECSQNLMI